MYIKWNLNDLIDTYYINQHGFTDSFFIVCDTASDKRIWDDAIGYRTAYQWCITKQTSLDNA